MAADVASAAGRRTLFAWYLFDEPDLNALSAGAYLQLAKLCRAAESRRPILLSVQSPDNYAAYVAGCDILAVDP
jgi:enoyl-CoA hydratase/carnithine racemase